MTTPRLAMNTGYGRLYRLPSTPADSVEDWRASVESGLLVPSVTNVIGVMDKPYLQTWHAKLAAEEAVAVVMEHPNLVSEKPEKAQKWFKEAAKRYTEEAADIGDRVHDAVERLSRGEEDFTADEDIEAFVTSWKKFVKEFEPEFLHLEATCYGWVPADDDGPPLGYAGTADFIARIRGKVVVGDYKCVTPDTLILMADGTEKKASEVCIGDLVTGYSEETQSLCVAPVEYVGSNGEKPTVVLTMSGSRRLQVTEEHPVLIARNVLNSRNLSVDKKWCDKRMWVEAKDVKVGDYCVVAFGYGGMETQSPLSYSEAYLMGALIGDGCLVRTTSPKFTNEDPEIVKEIDFLLRAFGGGLSQQGKKTTEHGIVFNRSRKAKAAFLEWLEKHEMRCGAYEKKVPQAVLNGGRTAWIGFLSGLLDTDGHIRDTKDNPLINWSSASYELMKGCQHLLANLGVCSHVNEIRGMYKGEQKVTHRVAVHNRAGIATLGGILRPVGPKRLRLDHVHSRTFDEQFVEQVKKMRNIDAHHELIKVIKTEKVTIPTETIAISILGVHTHVTNGIITHNSGKSVHTEAGIQLSSLAHASQITLEDDSLVPMPAVDGGIAVHLRRSGFSVYPVTTNGVAWDAFCKCRRLWNFHAENLHSRAPLLLGPSLNKLPDDGLTF